MNAPPEESGAEDSGPEDSGHSGSHPAEPVRAEPVRNVFVVGLDAFHQRQLQALPRAGEYAFHALFQRAELRNEDGFPVEWLLEEGERRLRAFPGTVDAIVGYWDFPATSILPLLRREAQLPGPSLESALACEHKYWCRLEQSRVVPEFIPAFCAVNPFAEDPLAQVTLDFPFWLKPVKAVLSYLGFLVRDEESFRQAIELTRQGIGRFGAPFNHLLGLATVPSEVAAVDGYHCIAESLISTGRQCTLEGFSHHGQVQIYGTVDSWREGRAHSSFSRYQYPSVLPEPVQQRMADIAARVIVQIGYDDAPFNMEFYWEEDSERIWLLEINPRISKSHAPLFQMVDGCYHHQVMIDLGLGQAPAMPHRQGAYACAAKFMVRRTEDARVVRVPTPEEIAAIESEWPGVTVQVAVTEGMRLSELQYQDSYSFEVATLFVGAQTPDELEQKYAAVMACLPLEFAPDPQAGGPRRPWTSG